MMTYNEYLWKETAVRATVMGIVAVVIYTAFLWGCASLDKTSKVNDFRDFRKPEPVVVDVPAVRQEYAPLGRGKFLELLRQACRESGTFSLMHEGKAERYMCYPVEG